MGKQKIKSIYKLRDVLLAQSLKDSLKKIGCKTKLIFCGMLLGVIAFMIGGFVLQSQGEILFGGLAEMVAIILLVIFVNFLERNDELKKYRDSQEIERMERARDFLKEEKINTRDRLLDLISYAEHKKRDGEEKTSHYLHTKDLLTLEFSVGGSVILAKALEIITRTDSSAISSKAGDFIALGLFTLALVMFLSVVFWPIINDVRNKENYKWDRFICMLYDLLNFDPQYAPNAEKHSRNKKTRKDIRKS